MPNPLELKQQALGKINGALTALELYPDIPMTTTMKSLNFSTNPIDLIVDIFKSTQGYDMLVEKVSEYIAYGIPALEIATKAILLSNIQSMLSCSTTPLITWDIVQNGAMFDIHQIDLLNIFNYSPLSKEPGVGKYYYFGCDSFAIEDEVKYSDDLNAVLWYCIQHPNERVVWRKKEDREVVKNTPANIGKKHTKEYGIVTFEYSNRPSGIKNYQGDLLSGQEPIPSCLHCFVGCADKCESSSVSDIRNIILNYNSKLNTLNTFFKELDKYRKQVDTSYRQKNTEGLENGEDNDYFIAIKSAMDGDLDSLTTLETMLRDRPVNMSVPDTITLNSIGQQETIVSIPSEFVGTPTIVPNKSLCYVNIVAEKYKQEQFLAEAQADWDSSPAGANSYPAPEQNYYFRHLLMEFNTDFVLNTTLFDRKVITARLIDALTSCLDMSAELSLEERIMRAQVRDMVERMIQSDDTVVNDCFFAFTNDQYNSMLNDSELLRMGIPINNAAASENAASAQDILDSLNNISPDSTEEEIQSVVKGMLFSALSSTNPHGSDEYSYDLNLNIIENLLTQLVYVIVTVILSPKVYILLMINLKLLGHEPNFDLKKFIEQFKQMINELIKSIRDQIIQFFYDEIMGLLRDIFFKLGIEIKLEQYKYYIELLRHCLDCLKLHASEYDWAQDAVNYADITEANQIINQEC